MNRSRAEAPSPPLPTGSCLRCVVTPDDVEAMLDAYDSGMCDLSTANCLCRAVTRALSTSQRVSLIRHDESTAHLCFEGRKVPVPESLLTWLDSAEIGLQTGPIDFTLRIPEAEASETPRQSVPEAVSLSR